MQSRYPNAYYTQYRLLVFFFLAFSVFSLYIPYPASRVQLMVSPVLLKDSGFTVNFILILSYPVSWWDFMSCFRESLKFFQNFYQLTESQAFNSVQGITSRRKFGVDDKTYLNLIVRIFVNKKKLGRYFHYLALPLGECFRFWFLAYGHQKFLLSNIELLYIIWKKISIWSRLKK